MANDQYESVKTARNYDGALPPASQIRPALALYFEEEVYGGSEEHFSVVLQQMSVPKEEHEGVIQFYKKNKTFFERIIAHRQEAQAKQRDKIFHYRPTEKFIYWDEDELAYSVDLDKLQEEAKYDHFDVYTGRYLVIFNPTKSYEEITVDTRDVKIPEQNEEFMHQLAQQAGLAPNVQQMQQQLQQLQQQQSQGNQQQIQQLQQQIQQAQQQDDEEEEEYELWSEIIDGLKGRDELLVIEEGEITARF